MFRRSLLALGLVAAAFAATPAASQAEPVTLPDIDFGLTSCTQLTPHAVSVTSERVRLDLRILLDGARKREAKMAVASMRKAFGPLGISVAPTYERARLTGTDASKLIAQAKKKYGGKRPAGVDVVYVLTGKDIELTGPGAGDLVGFADCIGGIRYANHAFAIGEVGRVFDPTLDEGTGKTMAHEIGHLMGGHHHYSSAEGLLAPEPAPLSLMGNAIDVVALRFSTLNSLMVRGHAQKYAD